MLSVVALSSMAAVALYFASTRRAGAGGEVECARAARALLVASAVQVLHFSEEAATGLDTRLPGLIGQAPYPFALFALLNLSALGIWFASVAGVRAGREGPFFAAWFLAVASVFNGIVHPLVALGTGGYFPGVLTAPVCGIAGIFLWLRLRDATRPAPDR